MRKRCWLGERVKCRAPGDLPGCNVDGDELELQYEFAQFVVQNGDEEVVEKEWLFDVLQIEMEHQVGEQKNDVVR